MPDYFGLATSAISGFFAAIKDNAKNYGRTYYARRLHPEVSFAQQAYADKFCHFEGPARIKCNAELRRVRMGKHSFCSENCLINFCEIGRYCSIAPEVRIGLGVHPTQFISTYPGFYSPQKHSVNYAIADVPEAADTIIGHDVWIGSRVIIPGGITIGDGAIIGAGAVVTKDVAPYTIVGGVPARVIRQRFTDNEIQLLLKFRWWDQDEDFLHRHGHLFTDPQKFFTLIRETLNGTEE